MLARTRVYVLFLALIVLALANCRGATTGQGPEISLNFGFDPPTLDPALVGGDPPSTQVDRLLFLNLTDLGDDGTPRAGLAREWLVSSDGLVWEFHLRTDVTWVYYDSVTGRSRKEDPITADDVVYSVRRLFDPRTGSSYAHVFAPLIRNATALNNADPRTAPQDLDRLAAALGVKAKDKTTVQFILTRPMSAFPALTATWLGRVVPKKPIDDNGISWSEPGNLWSSGPYMLESWDHNQSIVLRRNPYYFDSANVQIERLHFNMIPDVASALDAYQRGSLDTTDPYDTVEGDQLARVAEDANLKKDEHVLPGLCTQYIGFDVRQPPFDNPQARVAFATALDRETIVKQDFPLGTTARWFTPPDVVAAPDISATLGIPFDAPQAKDLLDQTGWGVGQKALPELTFGVNPNDTFIQAAVAAAQNWKAALSASVTIDSDYSDFQAYLTKLGTAPPPIFRLGYCASYPDAASFAYDVFHSGSLYNFTHWTSPAYDRLVEQAARETDALKRRALYTAAEKILIEDQAAIVPLVWTTRVSLTNSRVERSYAVMQGYDHVEYWRVSR